MSSLRLWIAVLALVCFGAGTGLGLYIERSARGESAPGNDYEALFLREFELSPERRRLFEELMGNYKKEVEEVRQRALADSLDQIELDLGALGRRYRDWVRNRVLPEDQRPRFDALSQAIAWQPPR